MLIQEDKVRELPLNLLAAARRPEVKAATAQDGRVWLGAADGLYLWHTPGLRPVPGWQGHRFSALAACPDGLVVAAEGPEGSQLAIVDGDGGVRQALPALSGVKALAWCAGELFAGTKNGIFRLHGDSWQCCNPEAGEVIGLQPRSDGLLAFCKKQGRNNCPALLKSADAGVTWLRLLETGYHDGIIAAWGDQYITRWRGPWAEGQAVKHQKRPFSAAARQADTCAWITGNKLVVTFAQGAVLELDHPAFAEAEHLYFLASGAVLVAGIQGAYSVELGHGQVTDLFTGTTRSPEVAKIKRLWNLDEGRVLAVTTYGTFYLDHLGDMDNAKAAQPDVNPWQTSRSDWAVLDGEGLALSPDGAWYLAAQRGLFSSWDNGSSWQQVKIATKPHFAELTGVAFFRDRLVLGSKAGLFISEPDQPKQLQHLAAVGDVTIRGLLTAKDALWVGTDDGRLLCMPATTLVPQTRACFPAACVPVAEMADELCVLSGGQLYRVSARGVIPATLPRPDALLKGAAMTDQGLLVWYQTSGWLLRVEDASDTWCWRQLNGWPSGVKSATRLAPLLVTDRQRVATVSL